MPPPCGALTPNKKYTKDGNVAKEGCAVCLRYSDSVSAMLSNLGWRSLEYRRNDSRLAMFYKIQYGLVAVPMPSYLERPIGITRHIHPLSFHQVHISGIRFFPYDCCFVE